VCISVFRWSSEAQGGLSCCPPPSPASNRRCYLYCLSARAHARTHTHEQVKASMIFTGVAAQLPPDLCACNTLSACMSMNLNHDLYSSVLAQLSYAFVSMCIALFVPMCTACICVNACCFFCVNLFSAYLCQCALHVFVSICRA